MADEKPVNDEAARIAIATLIVEGRVRVEAAATSLEMLIVREGATPELIVLGKHLAQAKEALADVDHLLANAVPTPEAHPNG